MTNSELNQELVEVRQGEIRALVARAREHFPDIVPKITSALRAYGVIRAANPAGNARHLKALIDQVKALIIDAERAEEEAEGVISHTLNRRGV